MAPTLADVLRESTERLAAAGVTTARIDAERLVSSALGVDRGELYLGRDRLLDERELVAVDTLVDRRVAREPLQHVLGEWGFRRLTLAVDRRALVPRPETEIVVERALALITELDRPTVLDVGTGTGAIGLAIADEHPGARVTGIDSSAEALELAAENVARTGLPLELRHWDFTVGLPSGTWDLVVSNPPYIDPDDRPALEPEVAQWEPEVALFGIGLHELVGGHALAVLAPNGWLVLEVGERQSPGVVTSLVELGYAHVATTRDLTGRERVVEGRR